MFRHFLKNIAGLTIIIYSVLVTCKKGGFHLHLSEEEPPKKNKIDSYLFNFKGTMRQSFALNFFISHGTRDMACSPLSAMLPLAKLALGADDETKEELLDAIGITAKKLKSETKGIIRMLRKVPGVKLTVASRIFMSDRVEVKKKFEKDTKEVFRSAVQRVDFSKPEKVEKKINEWIKGEIKNAAKVKIDYKLTGPQESIIINIVTFVGNWEHKFEHIVDNAPFYSPKGEISVPMMGRQDFYRYYKSDAIGAQVIEIPYEKKKASFVIVLPFTRTGLPSVLQKLKSSPSLLNDAIRRMFPLRVILSFPKFKIFTNGDIVANYRSVGVKKIFHPFSGLTNIINHEDPLIVNAAYQVTVVDVNEVGTQAASATAVELMHVSLNLDEIVFHADHPFLFYIKSANEQIFAGTYAGA